MERYRTARGCCCVGFQTKAMLVTELDLPIAGVFAVVVVAGAERYCFGDGRVDTVVAHVVVVVVARVVAVEKGKGLPVSHGHEQNPMAE